MPKIKQCIRSILLFIFLCQSFYVGNFIKNNVLKKSTCKELDTILFVLREEQDSLDILKFCEENIKYEDTKYKDLTPGKKKEADDKYRRMISRLVESGKAKRIDQNKNYLTITDSGVIFKGFTKERKNKITSKIAQHFAWYAIIFGIGCTIIGIYNKKNIYK